MKRRLLLASAASLIPATLLGFAGRAHAQAGVPEAERFIADLSRRAIADLTDLSLSDAERARRFGVLLRANFDVPAIGQFVLGRYWRIATEAERNEFQRLFENYLIQIYAKRFKDYTGENLRVDRTRAAAADEIVVNSTILRSQLGPALVVWRLRRAGGGFRIFDVAVEGVSLAITHRDDFAAYIQRSGGKVEALLAWLRDKAKQGPVA